MPPVARPKGPLTLAEVREQIDYDPVTGVLTWKIAKPRIRPGRRAGSQRTGPKLYRSITVCKFTLAEHVFIWFWMTGKWPKAGYTIDHKNRIQYDNRWENLREATLSEQQRNTDRYGPNRGIQVRVGKGGTKYRVRMRPRDNPRNIGTFNTLEEAREAFRSAAKEAYGDFFNAS
jgi:hypothetical protein